MASRYIAAKDLPELQLPHGDHVRRGDVLKAGRAHLTEQLWSLQREVALDPPTVARARLAQDLEPLDREALEAPGQETCFLSLQGSIPRGVFEAPYFDESGSVELVAVTQAARVIARESVRTAEEYSATMARLEELLEDLDPVKVAPPDVPARILSFPAPAQWARAVRAAKPAPIARGARRGPARTTEQASVATPYEHPLFTMGRMSEAAELREFRQLKAERPTRRL